MMASLSADDFARCAAYRRWLLTMEAEHQDRTDDCRMATIGELERTIRMYTWLRYRQEHGWRVGGWDDGL